MTPFGRNDLVQLITYDLIAPNDKESDYERVISGLKTAYPVWCHLEKSVWLVSTEQDSSSVRDNMKKLFYDTDVLFVAKLQGNWASFNIGTKRADWIKERTF